MSMRVVRARAFARDDRCPDCGHRFQGTPQRIIAHKLRIPVRLCVCALPRCMLGCLRVVF